MECPNPACDFEDILESDGNRCPECGMLCMECPWCHSLIRPFSLFCRSCGKEIPDLETDWALSRGDARSLGLSHFVMKKKVSTLNISEKNPVTLPDRCRGILFVNGYMIAASSNGEIVFYDTSGKSENPLGSFPTGSKMYASPAVSHGCLFLSTQNSVRAYTLHNTVFQSSDIAPLWEVHFPGTPVRALFPFLGCIYVNVIGPDRYHEIYQINHESLRFPVKKKPAVEKITRKKEISFMAGDANPLIRKLHFLSRENGKTFLHTMDHLKNTPEQRKIPVEENAFSMGNPMAAIGNRVFSIFNPGRRFLRININSGKTIQTISANVNEFSLAGIDEPIIINPRGMYFKRVDKLESFSGQGLMCSCPPIVFKDRAAALAMSDGRVYIYDLRNPGTPLVWNAAAPTDRIVMLAAWKNVLAAGTENGSVRVCELI